MKRPLAYVTAAWCGSDHENAKLAAQYCRTVYEAGFSPICPTLYQPLFLNDAVPEEHKSGIDMGRDLLRRSHVLVVCGNADLSVLPAGEKAVLELVALRLLCAVAQPHIYSETVVIAACAGGEFTAKGKTVKHPGWKALEDAYRAKTKDAEPKKEGAEKAVPELTEGQTLSVSAAIVKEGKSSPPQHFTEDICCERGIRNHP